MPTQITISQRPPEINIEAIEIEPHQCHLNSYRISQMYPSVEIIEGLYLLVGIDNSAKAYEHVWNKVGDIHFDATREILENNGEIREIRYLMIHAYNDFTSFEGEDIFTFSPVTIELVKDQNTQLLI